jgi:hypothetical protein
MAVLYLLLGGSASGLGAGLVDSPDAVEPEVTDDDEQARMSA